MRTCTHGDVRQIEAGVIGSAIRLWGRQHQLDALRRVLGEHFRTATDEPQLCFMGSGDFHHITALLLPCVLEKNPEPVTLIHFDNHPDWVRFDGGISCGSWVNHAANHPQVAKVITIGVCSNDLWRPNWKGANLDLLSGGTLELFPYAHAPSRVHHDYGAGASYTQKGKHLHWRTIEEIGEAAFIDLLVSRIPTKNVYITIDKDVLTRDDAETNWDQGMMQLPLLLALLRTIGEQHRIIGTDVNGDYSRPRHHGDPWTLFKKKAERVIDQPFHPPTIAAASAINSATNHALLEVLSEVMA